MILEAYDSEKGNSFVARVKIDYDYQAEEWVVEICGRRPEVVKLILVDSDGVRCIWERKEGYMLLPDIVHKTEKYTGEYGKYGPQVDPKKDKTHNLKIGDEFNCSCDKNPNCRASKEEFTITKIDHEVQEVWMKADGEQMETHCNNLPNAEIKVIKEEEKEE